MDNIVSTEWYASMIDDCRAIATEKAFESRWAVIEMYHGIAERICSEENLKDRKSTYGKKILQTAAESLGMPERTLYYAIAFYEMFPDLNSLKEGKNISWNRIVTNYLTDGGKPDHEPSKWTMTKYLWTFDLSRLPKELKEAVEKWQRQGSDLYGKVKEYAPKRD